MPSVSEYGARSLVTPAMAPQRLAIVDVARGSALVAMVIYHGAWDLHFFALAPIDPIGNPAWTVFARLIAGSFLAIVGVSLVLAARSGWRAWAFGRRLALVGGAALAVTLVTALATPAEFIFFGILHCIALSSVLALPFLKAPIWLVITAGVVVLVMPQVWREPLFDTPALRWVGLGTVAPATNDYVPLFPWFSAVLLGLAAARLALASRRAGGWRWQARGALSRALAWAGGHSLVIYLIHQPLLFGAFWLVLQAAGPNGAAETASFTRSCVTACVERGDAGALCQSICACSAEALKRDDLWLPLLKRGLDSGQEVRARRLIAECRPGE